MAAIPDSRRGEWALADHLEASLAIEALDKAPAGQIHIKTKRALNRVRYGSSPSLLEGKQFPVSPPETFLSSESYGEIR